MISTREIQETVIEPMQRYWSAPAGDAQTLDYQIREMVVWCRSYTPAQLRAAYEWLKENYTYRTWPKIADWKKAVNATVGPRKPDKQEKRSWELKMEQAAKISDAEMETPLGRRALAEGWGHELRAAYRRLAYESLCKGKSVDHLIVDSRSLEYWAKKADSFRRAKDYQQTPEYLAVHGVPYKPAV